jgi:TrmH family RNA methyltransferase
MIESLHSPHIARVKALIGSKGVRERRESGLFVAEGLQSLREALTASSGPKIKTLYLTSNGALKLKDHDLNTLDVVEVSDAVMAEMTSTVTPQGILALCDIPRRSADQLATLSTKSASRVIYLNEIQDPGNAGTILRSADAMGVDAVITSPGSVDMYSPKVVRSTAGSHWHIALYESLSLSEVVAQLPASQLLELSSHADTSILTLPLSTSYISIFGNEARGVDAQSLGIDLSRISQVTIPMAGRAESLNLSAAASIVMFTLSQRVAG